MFNVWNQSPYQYVFIHVIHPRTIPGEGINGTCTVCLKSKYKWCTSLYDYSKDQSDVVPFAVQWTMYNTEAVLKIYVM